VIAIRENLLSQYLVRHNQTKWSLAGQLTGSMENSLTAPGGDEARTLIQWLPLARIDRFSQSRAVPSFRPLRELSPFQRKEFL
jgi:broad specificity phosphatase PhoE